MLHNEIPNYIKFQEERYQIDQMNEVSLIASDHLEVVQEPSL